MSKSWEAFFFSIRKDSGRNLTEIIKFLRAPSYKLSRNLGEKDTAIWREKKIIPASENHAQEICNKRKKKKENFGFFLHIGICVKSVL